MFESDELIDRVANELRAPTAGPAGAKARVMAAVREAARPAPLPRVWRWLSRRRPIMVSPLGAGVVAAAMLAVLFIRSPIWNAGGQHSESAGGMTRTIAAVAAPAPIDQLQQQEVQFVFVAAGASRVSVVGDFNDWDPTATPLRQTASGVWTIVMPLESGRHLYAFVVDGTEWLPDPRAPRAPDDDFGTPNSVLMVGGQST